VFGDEKSPRDRRKEEKGGQEMGHGIYKEKFVSVREPAWHRIGLHFLEPIPPSLAARVAGFEEPELVDLSLPNGQVTGYKAVVSREGEVFGVVSKNWELIRLEDVLETLDGISEHLPLSSAGQLRGGRYIFFTFEHRGEIAGEEYLKHLVVLHSYEPGKAWKVLYTPTRAVCMNTLVIAEREASVEFSVRHLRGATDKAKATAILALSQAKQQEVDAKLEALAKVGDFDAQIDALLDYVYAFPEPPKSLPGEREEVLAEKKKIYEAKAESIAFAREAFMESYNRFNDEFPRLANTAYAGLQAVVETADWRTGVRRTPRDSRRLDEARVLGSRAREKAMAWDFLSRLL